MSDYIYIANFVLAVICGSIYLTASTREYIRHFIRINKIEGQDKSVIDQCQITIQRIKQLRNFIMISGIILTTGLIFLYKLTELTDNHSAIVAGMLSSGIHVPILLMLYGIIIRFCYIITTKNTDDLISADEKSSVLLIISTAINICFALNNLKLALFTLSIIIGKFIWIDFVYDFVSVKTFFKSFMQKTDSDGNVSSVWISEQYSTHIIIRYLLSSAAIICLSNFTDLSTSYKIYMTLVVHVILFASEQSAVGGLQIGLAQETFRLIKEQKEKKQP